MGMEVFLNCGVETGLQDYGRWEVWLLSNAGLEGATEGCTSGRSNNRELGCGRGGGFPPHPLNQSPPIQRVLVTSDVSGIESQTKILHAV